MQSPEQKLCLPRILIVDDSECARETLNTVLKDKPYELLFADSGEAAIKQTEHLVPDLILLDVMMPGMDGFKVCSEMRKDVRLSNVPIFFITALDDDDSFLQAMNAGGDQLISKPFNRERLKAQIASILERNAHRRINMLDAQNIWMLEQSYVAHVILDRGDKIRYANSRALQYLDIPLDYKPGELCFVNSAQKHYACQPENAWVSWFSDKSNASTPRYLVGHNEGEKNSPLWLQIQVFETEEETHLVLKDVSQDMAQVSVQSSFERLLDGRLKEPVESMSDVLKPLSEGLDQFNLREIQATIQRAYYQSFRLKKEVSRISDSLILKKDEANQDPLPVNSIAEMAREVAAKIKNISIQISDNIPKSSDCLRMSPAAFKKVMDELMTRSSYNYSETPLDITLTLSQNNAGDIGINYEDNRVYVAPEFRRDVWLPYAQSHSGLAGDFANIAYFVWGNGGQAHMSNKQVTPGTKIEIRLPLKKKTKSDNLIGLHCS